MGGVVRRACYEMVMASCCNDGGIGHSPTADVAAWGDSWTLRRRPAGTGEDSEPVVLQGGGALVPMASEGRQWQKRIPFCLVDPLIGRLRLVFKGNVRSELI